MNLNILAIGDAVGSGACDYLQKNLGAFKRENKIDFCICNGENSADGNGITPLSAESLFCAGVDFITTGNHVYKRSEIYPLLDESEFIIRPCNFKTANPGEGSKIIDCGFYSIGIINLMGNVYMENLLCPFDAVDRELEKMKNKTKLIFVDIHAEATSEKKALGYYLDGKVSAVFGTHTHVQTADAQILSQGTGYITDLGMCGATESVLGIDKEVIINKLRYNMPRRFTAPEGQHKATGCIFTVDSVSGKCLLCKAVAF
ncbi:MAG: TIGR00282 family metallophosphoesterase [Acutalibacteraceae bacterium]